VVEGGLERTASFGRLGHGSVQINIAKSRS
jgi:hypothetical protein